MTALWAGRYRGLMDDMPGLAARLQEHEGRSCARLAVACPRGCGASVARGKLAEHAASVCPREPVACTVGGCGAVVARSEMAAHVGGDAPAIARHVGALAAVCFVYSGCVRTHGLMQCRLMCGCCAGRWWWWWLMVVASSGA